MEPRARIDARTITLSAYAFRDLQRLVQPQIRTGAAHRELAEVLELVTPEETLKRAADELADALEEAVTGDTAAAAPALQRWRELRYG